MSQTVRTLPTGRATPLLRAFRLSVSVTLRYQVLLTLPRLGWGPGTGPARGTLRQDEQDTHLLPATVASPEVTAVSPVSILKVVVLPAPFTPRRPKH